MTPSPNRHALRLTTDLRPPDPLMAVVDSPDAIRCPANLHKMPWQVNGFQFRYTGCQHVLYVCHECKPKSHGLYVFTDNTGKLCMCLRMTAAQFHKAEALPQDSPTYDYLLLFEEDG